MSRRKRKGFTAGTVLMLIVTAVVLAAYAWVIARLTAGHEVHPGSLTKAVTEAVTHLQDADEAPGTPDGQ